MPSIAVCAICEKDVAGKANVHIKYIYFPAVPMRKLVVVSFDLSV